MQEMYSLARGGPRTLHSDYPLKGTQAEKANNDTLCLFSRCSFRKKRKKTGDSQGI